MLVASSLLGSLQLQREHREDSSSLQEGYTVSTDLCNTMLSEDIKEITIEVHANKDNYDHNDNASPSDRFTTRWVCGLWVGTLSLV